MGRVAEREIEKGSCESGEQGENDIKKMRAGTTEESPGASETLGVWVPSRHRYAGWV